MKDHITYFEGPWEREPNNNHLQANGALRSGIPYNGYVNLNDKDDFFSFYMLVGGSITVDLSDIIGGGQLQLFHNSIDNPVGPYPNKPPYYIEYTGGAGLYYIYIASTSGTTNTSPYTLTVTYPTPSTLPTSSPPPTSTPCPPTATPTSTPTATPTATPTSWVGYRFETGTQNWTTDEGDYKLAALDTTTQTVYSGSQALQLTTELSGNSTGVYKRTHALAYFTNAIPEGIPGPGPYNLTGKLVSCFVYFPSGWASGGNPQVYTWLFVRDTENDNLFGDPVDITPSNVNQWFQLSFTVVDSPPFNADRTLALGVAIYLQNGSTFQYTGPIYIDACSIEYP